MALYLRHPSSLRHDTGPHPENADRVRAIETALEHRDWMGLEVTEAPPAARDQILRVHDQAHFERLESHCAGGGGMLDLDTIAVEASWEAALCAAGAAVEGARRLLGGEVGGGAGGVPFAFSGCRPPGHHAESGRAMGFCLFNNAAVAAAHSIASLGAERVMILDWDVHHGNGTEEIFYGSDLVLYSSIHQDPLYPGTGAARDIGRGDGSGYTVNLPVAPGAGADEFLSLLQHVVAPIARAFDPSFLIISAGFDAHRADPLAQCSLEAGSYGEMAAAMAGLAAELGAPILVCLEGGYDLTALAESTIATIAGLGSDVAPRGAPRGAAAAMIAAHADAWPVLLG